MPTTRAIDRLSMLQVWRRAYDAKVWDRWLAAVFTILAFVPPLSTMSAVFGDLPRRPADGFAVFLVLVQTVPLALRSRWPAACLAVIGASFAVYETLGYPPQFGTVTVYLALYSVGAHLERFRRGAAVVASMAYLALAIIVEALGSPDRPIDYVIFYVALAAFWVLGTFVRRRRAEEAERRRLAALAATAEERARIARELHDVVTHHVTAIVVQADATQFVADSPERVTKALTVIGGTGRRALTELRHLLDVLEATSAVDNSLQTLVERTRQGGQPVELFEQDAFPAGIGLAVYRVVQEGLTNAVKYAPGRPTVVRTARRDGHAEVEIVNDAVPISAATRRDLSGGRGINGLRDRLSSLGGEITASDLPDGRFRLHATIPIRSNA
jgi:signal transduction histidine kinase